MVPSATNKKKFNIGSEVQKISDSSKIGVIVEIDCYHGGVWYYVVNFGSGERVKVPETDLIEYIPNRKPSDILKLGKLGNYDEFQRNILYQKLSKVNILTNNIYAFNSSRTLFYPYQFKPLLKFLESMNNRILIADEVGLGKTIEAGLIYTELKARQNLQRVLIICPSNLKEKWRSELEKRFGEEFELLNSKGFARFLDKYEEFPQRVNLKAIISLESIRQASILERLEGVAPDFDLVIIDEAHHMRNSETKQHRVGKYISETADAMLMLSATPIQLGSEDLFRLLNILDEESFPDFLITEEQFTKNEPVVKAQTCIGGIPPDINKALSFIGQAEKHLKHSDKPHLHSLCVDILDRMNNLKNKSVKDADFRRQLIELQREVAELNILSHIFNRTRKREVKEKIVIRHSHAVKIELTEVERSFYEAVIAYVKAEARRKGKAPFIQQWMTLMPQRRVTSSISAMVNYYRKHIGLDDEDRAEDDEFLEIGDTNYRYKEFAEARDQLKRIIEQWSESNPDSKFQKFIEILSEMKKKEGRCKAIIFAFFKDTLRYLHDKLKKGGYRVLIMSGDTPPKDRYKIISEFENNDEIEILLSSRVGSEGLDFQFCDTMFNYDLPWNPMEVEQRIGRLDRIGQKKPSISIYNFYIKDTIEERILGRLYERIGIFERSIGELEPIIGGEIKNLIMDLINKDLTPHEEVERIERSARIIENKRQELEKLEKNTSKFIGVDNYFDEEIDRIRRTKRYITAEQLKYFVFDFLGNVCPRTRINFDVKEVAGKIYPDTVLQKLITDHGKSSELIRFFSTEHGVDITFSSDFAFESPGIEFINNSHPLVQMLMGYYKKEELKTNNAYHVLLKTNKLRGGTYFYFIFRVKVTAAKDRNTLEAIYIDDNLNVVCFDEAAEELLGEMLENGKTADVSNFDIDEGFINKAYLTCKQKFLDKLNLIKNDTERNNNLLVEGRISSIKMNFSKKIKQKKKQLEKGRVEKKNERYLRMLSSYIQRLSNELESAVQKEEKKKVVAVEYDEVAAGILEVFK